MSIRRQQDQKDSKTLYLYTSLVTAGRVMWLGNWCLFTNVGESLRRVQCSSVCSEQSYFCSPLCALNKVRSVTVSPAFGVFLERTRRSSEPWRARSGPGVSQSESPLFKTENNSYTSIVRKIGVGGNRALNPSITAWILSPLSPGMEILQDRHLHVCLHFHLLIMNVAIWSLSSLSLPCSSF